MKHSVTGAEEIVQDGQVKRAYLGIKTIFKAELIFYINTLCVAMKVYIASFGEIKI